MENLVVLDCEVYPNYTLFAFKNIDNDKTITLEIKGKDSTLNDKDLKKLNTIMHKRTTFGFNSRNYDIPIILYALKGTTAKNICDLSNYIIDNQSQGWQTLKKFNLIWSKSIDHFDIQEPSPGVKTSLKLYGARMHSKKLQDIPIKPNSILTDEEMEETLIYCVNDLDTTIELYRSIEDEIKLRVDMSEKYRQNLLSKSDAQIAEVVIKSELESIYKRKLYKPKLSSDYRIKYRTPSYIKFNNSELQNILKFLSSYEFKLNEEGYSISPKELEESKIKLGSSYYQMGMGGLHSTEEKQSIIPNKNQMLVDRDVTSYYPTIILNDKLFPKHLGNKFLTVYKNIVDQRIKAKKEGNKTINESLKIVINGSFGKLGSKYSVLYSPDLLLQVTLTGQLSLLMLIEKLENNNIKVVSANTDGFITLLNKDQYSLYDTICFDWELNTGFNLEETKYNALYSRDVNNYLAVTNGNYKGKGIFTLDSLKKNPQGNICVEAVIKFLIDNIPLEKTIKDCKDISKFLFARTVKGGAKYKGKYLGKVVRWIYSTNGDSINYNEKVDLDLRVTRDLLRNKLNLDKLDPILKISKKSLKEDYPEYKKYLVFKSSNPLVPKTTNSRPIMELEKVPNDIDYDRYIKESMDILDNLGIISN